MLLALQLPSRGQVFLSRQLQGGSGVFPFRIFFIMCRDDFLEVGGASVGHLHRISINYSVEGVGLGEVLIQKLEKFSPNTGFHIA